MLIELGGYGRIRSYRTLLVLFILFIFHFHLLPVCAQCSPVCALLLSCECCTHGWEKQLNRWKHGYVQHCRVLKKSVGRSSLFWQNGNSWPNYLSPALCPKFNTLANTIMLKTLKLISIDQFSRPINLGK